MLGQGVSSLAGSEGRGMLFLCFGGASGKGGHTAVGLGVAGLNFFLGVALFLFSVTSFFLTFGLVSGSGGLNWLLVCWNWNWSHLTFHLQKSLHFLYDSGMQMGPCAPGCTFDQLGLPVPSKNMCPLHGCNLHLYIHHLYQEFAPEEAMQEVALLLE